jgi:hypothetical protein
MLKKEICDAFRKFLECIIILLALPLAIALDKLVFHDNWDFHLIFKVFFIITVVLYSFYSGTTIFQSEKRDKALEYLFSLPLPRWKIALYKIVPRLVLLILLLSVSPFFSLFENIHIAGFNLITLFFISVFLSIAINSVFIGMLGSGTLYLLYYTLYRTISHLATKTTTFAFIPDSYFSHQLISALLLLIPMGIAFWITFRSLDVKPLNLQLKPYVAIFLPTTIILTSLIVFLSLKYLPWLKEL